MYNGAEMQAECLWHQNDKNCQCNPQNVLVQKFLWRFSLFTDLGRPDPQATPPAEAVLAPEAVLCCCCCCFDSWCANHKPRTPSNDGECHIVTITLSCLAQCKLPYAVRALPLCESCHVSEHCGQLKFHFILQTVLLEQVAIVSKYRNLKMHSKHVFSVKILSSLWSCLSAIARCRLQLQLTTNVALRHIKAWLNEG